MNVKKISATKLDAILAPFLVKATGDLPICPANGASHFSAAPAGEIEQLLASIPSDDYTAWVTVGQALKNTLGECGYKVWCDWSQKSPKFNAAEAEKKWFSFKVGHPNPVGVGTIRWLACQHGYAGAPSRGWTKNLRYERGKAIQDEENVLRALRFDPDLQDLITYDEFIAQILISRPITSTKKSKIMEDYPRPWRDADSADLQTHLQRGSFPRIGRDKVDTALRLFAERFRAFHPLREELLQLQWDGQPRIDQWLEIYLGAIDRHQDPKYVRGVGRLWLRSLVARVLRPGCQADHVLVLEGPQGCGKTSALRILGGRYFSESLPHDLGSKDSRDHVRGAWLIELAELGQLRKSEMELVKGFISRTEERFRPVYARHEIQYKRQCAFAGTTNEAEFLLDPTGNRRFWPVSVDNIDLNALAADRDQLLAEAVAEVSQGGQWHPDPQLAKLAAAEASRRLLPDPWLPDVIRAIGQGELGWKEQLTAMAVLREFVHDQRDLTPGNARRVAGLLRRLGWRSGRKTSSGQLFIRPPASLSPQIGDTDEDDADTEDFGSIL